MSADYSVIEITDNKKHYLPWLLMADEQEDMIDRYLDSGNLYVMSVGGRTVAVCVTVELPDKIVEIKNLAVDPDFRRQGFGRKMVRHIASEYPSGFILQVGTGEAPYTVSFYLSCGFVYSHRIDDFFTRNYRLPIIDGGVLLRNMLYFRMKL